MDNVNQPQGNGPQDHSPTQPQWFTPSDDPGDPSGYEEVPPGQQHPGGPWLAGPEPYQQQPYQPDLYQPQPYQQNPYHWQPGGPGPYAQQPGSPGPYTHQPGSPGPYAQQPGVPGPYGQQPGGPGPYAQQFGGQNPPTQQLFSPGGRPPQRKRLWMRDRKVRWGAGIAAAVLLGAGGTSAGLALAGSSAPPANAPQAVALNSAIGYTTGCSLSSVTKDAGSAAIKADRLKLKRCLRARLHILKGQHGEVAYHTTSGTQTLAYERGSIVSASGSKLSVKAGDGTTWTWDEAGSPIIHGSGKEASITELQTGTKVFIGGLATGSSREAKLIIVRGAQSGSGKNAGHGKNAANSSGPGGSSGSAA